MRKEIERRLDLINRIKLEPKLVPDDDLILSNAEGTSPETLCRMHALDEIQMLGKIFNYISHLFHDFISFIYNYNDSIIFY